MRIDLHAHSSASDGTQPPADVVCRAAAAGLDVVALTDHDTTDGWVEAIGALPAGLTLVPGAEVSAVVDDGGRAVGVHMLAYLFHEGDPALAAELHRLRNDRSDRARQMVTLLQELGAPVEWEQVLAEANGAPIGRPHIARVLVATGAVATEDDAFMPDWLADGGRAWAPKHAVEPRHVVALVRAAGGVTVVAHPGARERGRVVSDAVIESLAEAGLDGMEVDHPDHDPATRQRLRAIAADLGLVVTGSSDDHGEGTGHRLGCETTSPAAYQELLERAQLPPVSA